MARVISVINYKGGVGKTTLTLELGVCLASEFAKKVLIVDLDPQCSLSLSTIDEHYWAERVERAGSIKNVLESFYHEGPELDPAWIIPNALNRAWDSMEGTSPGLDLLPSHLELPEYDMRLVSRKPRYIDSMEEFYLQRYLILREAISAVRRSYDFILFDCPPNIYMIARNAIIASDYYLVPTIPDFISCYGIPFILQHIQNMLTEMHEKNVRTGARFLGIVRNRVRRGGAHLVREHEEQSKKLRDTYGDKLLESMVMDRIGVAELLGTRKNIITEKKEVNPDMRGDFLELTREVLGRLEE
ncbi:MAG: AAA family ATPase [Spirochaetales bacterium]|nr:AAA family ATPase [Spirochaetales bacterium]